MTEQDSSKLKAVNIELKAILNVLPGTFGML